MEPSFALRQAGLGPLCARAIADILKNTSHTLLDLSGNRIMDAGATALAQLIGTSGYTQLVALCLRSCDIGPAGAEDLGAAIAKNQYLTHLDMSGMKGITRNHIGARGCQALCQCLALDSQVLCHLNLDENGISNEGCEALAEVLQKNTALQTLSLSSNGIGTPGGERLAAALPLSSVEWLCLSRNSIADTGVSELGKWLAQSSCPLKYLDISDNQITHRGARNLADSLRKNHSLTHINFSRNALKAKGGMHLYLFVVSFAL